MDAISPGGLCLACAATDNTANPTLPPVRPLPSEFSTAPPAGPGAPSSAPTAPARLTADTADAPAEFRTPPLPHAPAGYEIVEPLGHGGMGDVYLARELASDRLVAMKFLRNVASPDTFDRFAVELKSLAKLDHPNIVRVLSHDFLRAQPYFTMEYLPGGTLARRDGAALLSPDTAVGLFRTIAGAVAAAHAASTIHRDLKPSNVLLDANGVPKVADFGLAKRLDAGDDLTPTVGALGTPGYMPPEQVSRKNGVIGTWSDVYGLGATMYALLSGKAPFDGPTPVETMHRVLADPPARLRALRPDVPIGLEAIVLKCLAKDPKDRYQTVADLLADLDRYETGRRPVAPLMTPPRRLRLWAKRTRRGLITVATAAALLVGAFLLGAAYWPKLNPQEKLDSREKTQADRRQNLRDGKAIVLVGDRGEAIGSAWRFGGGTFGRAAPGDGIMFETIDTAMLELLDDPGVDSYTIRAQIRQTKSLGAANQRRDEDQVGVYFGHADLSSANPPTHAFFAVLFGDYDLHAPFGGPVRDQPAKLAHVLQTFDPQGRPYQRPTTFAQCMFAPVSRRPGDWRTIEIDVTPQELRVHWREETGKTKQLKGIPPLVPSAKFAILQEDLHAIRPNADFVLPTWSPRMPLGIYACSSALNVRNVTITPRPVP